MARQKARPTESEDYEAEREARIAEIMERVRRHQEQAARYLADVEELKKQGKWKRTRRKLR